MSLWYNRCVHLSFTRWILVTRREGPDRREQVSAALWFHILQSCQRMAPCVNLKLADFCFDSCAIRWIWAHSTTRGRTVNRNMCLLLSSLCQSCHQLPGGKTIKTYTKQNTLRSISLFYHPQLLKDSFARWSAVVDFLNLRLPWVWFKRPQLSWPLCGLPILQCSICSVSNDVSNGLIIKIRHVRSKCLFVVENGWKRQKVLIMYNHRHRMQWGCCLKIMLLGNGCFLPTLIWQVMLVI